MNPPPATQGIVLNGPWQESLTRLIQQAGTPTFVASFISLLKLIYPRSAIVCTLYHGNQPARSLYHDMEEQEQINLNTTVYDSGAYRLDPFFQAARNGFTGVSRMSDLAPKDFDRSLYYRTYYKAVVMADEVGLFFELDSEQQLVFSVGIETRARESSLQQCRDLYPLLASLVSLHGRLLAMAEEATKAAVEGRLRSFGAGLLTEREQDVAQLMLRGCKTTEIANLLGISESTIKVHRKHLYAKLQINSQAELFGLFMDEFQGV